jgi:hypothetical protein
LPVKGTASRRLAALDRLREPAPWLTAIDGSDCRNSGRFMDLAEQGIAQDRV